MTVGRDMTSARGLRETSSSFYRQIVWIQAEYRSDSPRESRNQRLGVSSPRAPGGDEQPRASRRTGVFPTDEVPGDRWGEGTAEGRGSLSEDGAPDGSLAPMREEPGAKLGPMSVFLLPVGLGGPLVGNLTGSLRGGDLGDRGLGKGGPQVESRGHGCPNLAVGIKNNLIGPVARQCHKNIGDGGAFPPHPGGSISPSGSEGPALPESLPAHRGARRRPVATLAGQLHP